MPLLKTSGNATADGYGGGAAAIPNYIEDVFSTYLYTGTGANQTITNGIDLSTKGGLVWTKSRSNAYFHVLNDTARGTNKGIFSNDTSGEISSASPYVTAFNTDGFSLGTNPYLNTSGTTNVSWTFCKQPKFYTQGTFTGNGSTQVLTHDLGSAPGCVIVKNITTAGSWIVWHRGLSSGYYIQLNGTGAQDNLNAARRFGNNSATVDPTSTTITVGDLINTSGDTWVYYAFAHNAGGFGLTGTDNVISCGSFTTNSSGNASVNLGYEPQWVLKRAVTADNWTIRDSMRGFPAAPATNGADLLPNSSDAESTTGSNGNYVPTATGFDAIGGTLSASTIYIYIAIRRGPMKVPTDATKVFLPNTVSSDASAQTTNFPVDMFLTNKRAGDALNTIAVSKLTSNSGLVTSSTAAEAANYASATWWQSNTSYRAGVWGTASIVDYAFQRAPSFFDEVCYTGTGTSGQTCPHNLGVVPELIIIKRRDSMGNWLAASNFGVSSFYASFLNLSQATFTTEPYLGYLSAKPTATNFYPGDTTPYNISAATYVAYLFATCAGVSKVFSFTGNGSTQTINCGFAGGARFVLLKATSTTGGWYVYDTARGMTTLTDPYLFLNSTAAESATLGSVTTVTTGFAVNESVLAGVNTNGVSYIGLAIA